MQTNARPLAALMLLAAWLLALPCRTAWADEYFDRYGLVPLSPAIDLGVQPLGYPSGVISSVMARDRQFQSLLAAMGHPLKVHAFRRGADMVGLLDDHRLEAGLLGDMPTLLAASTGSIRIVGLVKQSSTAIVSSGGAQVRELAGKRIGYVPVSSAHNTLLQGLASAGLGEADVKLLAMGVDDMPQALARGDIDAFAAWEPAPSIALASSDKNRIVFRGLSMDYFVIDRAFEQRAPEAARALAAAFVRAIEWMRRSQKNVEAAARWVMADSAAFTGKVPAVSVASIMAITRRDILNVASAPAIGMMPGVPTPLKSEFEFLRQLGKLPAHAKWENVEAALAYDGLSRILSEPRKFGIRVFDYAD